MAIPSASDGRGFFHLSSCVYLLLQLLAIIHLAELTCGLPVPSLQNPGATDAGWEAGAALSSKTLDDSPVFPQPADWKSGLRRACVANRDDFQFQMLSPWSPGIDLEGAFERYREIMFPRYAEAGPSAGCVLIGIFLRVTDVNAALGLHTDESYTLNIPSVCPPCFSPPCTMAAMISAETQYGAMRGLESFSQILHYDFNVGEYYMSHTPFYAIDAPRFPHRELLLDSSRHFLPIPTIKRVLDALPYAKINVLHWHIVDNQSFPLPTPLAPELARLGAYSPSERYSVGDVNSILEYARQRGVRVVAEIDMPGHAASWCKGYPEVCPSSHCTTPLDPTDSTEKTPDATNTTFALIDKIFHGLLGRVVGEGMFPDAYVHLGGDEVDTRCWNESERIRAWLDHNGWSEQDAYGHFVDRAHALAAARGRHTIGWQEVWESRQQATVIPEVQTGGTGERDLQSDNSRGNNFEHIRGEGAFAGAGVRRRGGGPMERSGGGDLDEDVVVQVWYGDQNGYNVTQLITQTGRRVIWSPDPVWYLDNHGEWEAAYEAEPCAGLSDTQCSYVLGGGGQMWGERMDSSNVEAIVWPRLAAIAERLWTPRLLVTGANATRARMHAFRCLLASRGVGAAPLGEAWAGFDQRAGPFEPGSCFLQ